MVRIFAKLLSGLGIIPSKKQYEEWAETCGFFCTFIETRYPGHPVPVPAGDEQTFYHACGFCLQIDSDGIASQLGLPDAQRQAMEGGLRQLGLEKLIDLVARAGDALRQSGIVQGRGGDRAALKALMEPFEDEYYDSLRDHAYARLHRFIRSSQAFVPYARNCARIESVNGNPFDPKEWTPEKIAAL